VLSGPFSFSSGKRATHPAAGKRRDKFSVLRLCRMLRIVVPAIIILGLSYALSPFSAKYRAHRHHLHRRVRAFRGIAVSSARFNHALDDPRHAEEAQTQGRSQSCRILQPRRFAAIFAMEFSISRPTPRAARVHPRKDKRLEPSVPSRASCQLHDYGGKVGV